MRSCTKCSKKHHAKGLCKKHYNQKDKIKIKEYQKKYQQTNKHKEYKRKYHQSDKFKEYQQKQTMLKQALRIIDGIKTPDGKIKIANAFNREFKTPRICFDDEFNVVVLSNKVNEK